MIGPRIDKCVTPDNRNLNNFSLLFLLASYFLCYRYEYTNVIESLNNP